MNTPSKLLNRLTNLVERIATPLFTMDTKPKSMESIKEGIIQETTTTEELTPIEGEELKVFNKLTEEQKQALFVLVDFLLGQHFIITQKYGTDHLGQK